MDYRHLIRTDTSLLGRGIAMYEINRMRMKDDVRKVLEAAARNRPRLGRR